MATSNAKNVTPNKLLSLILPNKYSYLVLVEQSAMIQSINPRLSFWSSC